MKLSPGVVPQCPSRRGLMCSSVERLAGAADCRADRSGRRTGSSRRASRRPRATALGPIARPPSQPPSVGALVGGASVRPRLRAALLSIVPRDARDLSLRPRGAAVTVSDRRRPRRLAGSRGSPARPGPPRPAAPSCRRGRAPPRRARSRARTPRVRDRGAIPRRPRSRGPRPGRRSRARRVASSATASTNTKRRPWRRARSRARSRMRSARGMSRPESTPRPERSTTVARRNTSSKVCSENAAEYAASGARSVGLIPARTCGSGLTR